MIEKLKGLIEEGESITSLCCHVNEYGTYFGGIQYEIWISKCILFLNNYFSENDLTVKFKNASADAINNSIEYYNTMIGVLYALKDMPEIAVSKTNLNFDKSKKLFISHANKDREYCDLLVDLIIDIGIKRDDIFYSSFDETGVKLGEDFLEFIKNEFTSDRDIYVLFMLSNNFYNSKICLAEMGATWIKAFDYLPILIPPTSFDDMKGVIKPTKNSMEINNSSKIEGLKEKLESMFNINTKLSSQAWVRKKEEYINNIGILNNKYKKENFEVVIDKILDYGDKKNSRLKLSLINNCKKVIRPSEIEVEITDEDGNSISETIDDARVSEVVLSPFETVILYVDLYNTNEKLRKARTKIKNSKSRYEYLS